MKDQLTRAHSGLCSPTLQPPAIQGQTGSSPFLTPQTQSPTFRGQLSKLALAYNAKCLCPDQLPQAKGRIGDPKCNRARQTPGSRHK